MLIDDLNKLIEEFPEDCEFLDVPDAEEVDGEIIGTTRWSVINRVVFNRNDEYVAVEYSTGATEYQDTEPEAVAYRVHPVKVVKTVYQRNE
jgi:hypothetical protein